MNKKLIIFSANYNSPYEMDTFRIALFRHFSSVGLEPSFFQVTDFLSDSSSKAKRIFANAEILDRLKMEKPAAVLFLNGAGRTLPVQEWIEKQKIPSLTWFWDHPGILSAELLQPRKFHSYAVVNRTYVSWFEHRLGLKDVPLIPFPSFDPPQFSELTEASWAKRSNPVLFMGTLWDPSRVPAMLNRVVGALGLTKDRALFYERLEKDVFLRNMGKTLAPDEDLRELRAFREVWATEADYLCEVNNYFSAIDRLACLRALLPLQPKYFGPDYCWNLMIESFLPELSTGYQYRNVSEPQDLVAVCHDSKLGFNVFHRQNQGGSTNFRFIEYAMAETPIVSNPNTECEKIFPHGVGAFYYKNPADLTELCAELLANPSLVVKTAKTAKEIAQEAFSIHKVATELAIRVGLAVQPAGHNPNPSFSRFLSSDVSPKLGVQIRHLAETLPLLSETFLLKTRERGLMRGIVGSVNRLIYRIHNYLNTLDKKLKMKRSLKKGLIAKDGVMPAHMIPDMG